MLEFQKYDWGGLLDRKGKFSTLTGSRALSFKMTDAPTHHLKGSVAVQPQSGLNLMEVFSSGHEITLEDTESLTVMMPRRGQIEVRHEDNARMAIDRGVVVVRPSLRRTLVEPPADRLFDGCLLKIPVLHPLLSEGLGRSTQPDDPFVRANEYAVPALSELVSYILTDLASDVPVLGTDRAALQVDALVDEHICRLLEAEPPKLLEGEDRNAARLVSIADEYMRLNYFEPLRITDIARVADVGTRQLQAAFKAVTNRTPWHHLSAIRLEQARLRLLAGVGTDTVSIIAMDCGFTHMGRFSALYRDTFHEAPSETLRRGGS